MGHHNSIAHLLNVITHPKQFIHASQEIEQRQQNESLRIM